LEKQKKELQADAEERRIALNKKASRVGNIVDASVPISQNEVCPDLVF
jgi:hypothetical protein